MEKFDTRYFRGKGPLFLGKIAADGTPQGLVFIGDISNATLTPQVERFEVKENVTGQDHVGASGVKSVSYDFSATMRSIRKEALEAAIRGSVSAEAASSVTDEEHTAHLGKFVDLDHVKVSSVVVTDAGGVTTYVADTDYKVHGDEGMIEILSGGAIADASLIEVDYDFADQQHVSADPKHEYFYLAFAGMNTADNDKQTHAKIHKIQLDPSALNLITDEVDERTLAGKLVRDTSRPVGDQLFSWQIED